MNPRALTGAVLLAVASLAMTGCSRERIDWKSAEAADTPESYNRFLERHPEGELAMQARARIAQIEEDKAWQRASGADTADAYRQFLAEHPGGKWAEEARIRMENFSLDSNPSPLAVPPAAATQAAKETAAAARVPSPTSPPATVAQPAPQPPSAATMPSTSKPVAKATSATGPASKPVTTASTTEDSPGYGIQLGAFSTQAAALSEWKRLQVAYDAQLHGLFAQAVPVQVTSGTLFRLQSPIGDESRARSICGELTKHSQPCVIVLPAEKR